MTSEMSCKRSNIFSAKAKYFPFFLDIKNYAKKSCNFFFAWFHNEKGLRTSYCATYILHALQILKAQSKFSAFGCIQALRNDTFYILMTATLDTSYRPYFSQSYNHFLQCELALFKNECQITYFPKSPILYSDVRKKN